VAIKPPAGSFSWINKRFVEDQGNRRGVVVTDENTPVSVLVGSSETGAQPTKESIKAKRGSLVIILDKEYSTDNGLWLPILPQPGEVRYIPASALQSAGAAPLVAANYNNPPLARASAAPGTPVVAAASQGAGDEVRNSLQKAYELETDPARRAQIQQVLATLPPRAAVAQLPGHPNNVAVSPAGPTAQAPGQTSLYATGNAAAPQAAPAQGTWRWSQYGVLRRTAYQEPDGRPVYALDDAQGRPLLYATPMPNHSLEQYKGRRLALWGSVAYNQNDPCLRTDVMTVSSVALLPPQNP
jgi:hypothetical protein